MVNVHTPYTDIRMRDLRGVISIGNYEILQKLIEMGDCAIEIANERCKHVRFLTKDTENTLPETCNSLAELSIHLLDKMHHVRIR